MWKVVVVGGVLWPLGRRQTLGGPVLTGGVGQNLAWSAWRRRGFFLARFLFWSWSVIVCGRGHRVAPGYSPGELVSKWLPSPSWRGVSRMALSPCGGRGRVFHVVDLCASAGPAVSVWVLCVGTAAPAGVVRVCGRVLGL